VYQWIGLPSDCNTHLKWGVSLSLPEIKVMIFNEFLEITALLLPVEWYYLEVTRVAWTVECFWTLMRQNELLERASNTVSSLLCMLAFHYFTIIREHWWNFHVSWSLGVHSGWRQEQASLSQQVVVPHSPPARKRISQIFFDSCSKWWFSDSSLTTIMCSEYFLLPCIAVAGVAQSV
jgi:hypothetical protein